MGGGGGKSTSTNSQTQTQQQTDSRQAVQDGIAIGAGGNYSNSASTTTNTSDSHAISDSGNSSTVVNWTGTDTGSLHLADLATELAKATGEQNLQALSSLEDLQATQGQNQLMFATHMLDTTGDLIGKFATGISAQANEATLQTAQASAQQQSNQQLVKYLLIGGGVIALAMVLRKG